MCARFPQTSRWQQQQAREQVDALGVPKVGGDHERGRVVVARQVDERRRVANVGEHLCRDVGGAGRSDNMKIFEGPGDEDENDEIERFHGRSPDGRVQVKCARRLSPSSNGDGDGDGDGEASSSRDRKKKDEYLFTVPTKEFGALTLSSVLRNRLEGSLRAAEVGS